jgi:non-specific protein-tyrosine kinase
MKLRVALDKAARQRRESGASPLGQLTAVQTDGTLAPLIRAESIRMPLDRERARANRCIVDSTDAAEANSYKVLRVKIQLHAQQHNLRTFLITSARPGDGKTLTAVNLALTLAQSYDQTVLLVDCDLNHQAVHKTLAIDSHVGLGDYLKGELRLHQTMIRPDIDKLTIVSGGRPVEKCPEALGSKRMEALVKELKNRYDNRLVLFDAPPLLGCADALSLLPLMDCVIIVAAAGRTTREDLRNAVAAVPQDKLLGVVLNRQKQSAMGKYEQAAPSGR